MRIATVAEWERRVALATRLAGERPDLGVQVVRVLRPGDPDAPTNQRTNTLTIDMMNGSPFIDFTKNWPAPADVWLTPYGAQGYNKIWGSSDLPGQGLGSNVLGVTSDVNWVDASGVTHMNISSYLIVASAGSWARAARCAARWCCSCRAGRSTPCRPCS